ncbi:UNVERIFIED_CONTAM: arylsulfatase A-like enzyme [Williamsia faeni]
MTDFAVPDGARGYEGFTGKIGRTGAQSQPAWAGEPKAPQRAPNIIVVLVDDMGYADIEPFGSEMPTPNLNKLAASGFRLSNYHTTSVCSPARAALLTGLNPHRAGYGTVANFDPGYPGFRLELADDVLTLPEILRENGYANFAVGKWHLVRDVNQGPGRSRESWPIQRGFDSYYGSLEGMNSFYYPNQLVADNSVVDIEEYPDDYYVTDDITDRAIGQIKGLRAHNPDKPFFLYFAHIAMHGPHQAKPQDLDRFRGKYAEGWDSVRQNRFDAQKRAGFFPPETEMAARNTEPGYDAPEWAALSADEQRRYQRYQEVYAAMVHSVDESVGRILDTVEALGELDNTIVVFTSDNGGTAEGGAEGTRSYLSQFVHSPVPADWPRDVPHSEDLIGSPEIGPTTPGVGVRRPTPRSGSTRVRPLPVGSGFRFSSRGRPDYRVRTAILVCASTIRTSRTSHRRSWTSSAPTFPTNAGASRPKTAMVSASRTCCGTIPYPPHIRSSTPSSAGTGASTAMAGNWCRCTMIRHCWTTRSGNCSTWCSIPRRPAMSPAYTRRRSPNWPTPGIRPPGTTRSSRCCRVRTWHADARGGETR